MCSHYTRRVSKDAGCGELAYSPVVVLGGTSVCGTGVASSRRSVAQHRNAAAIVDQDVGLGSRSIIASIWYRAVVWWSLRQSDLAESILAFELTT